MFHAPPDTPQPDDVLQAGKRLARIEDAIHRTPVFTCSHLDSLYGKQIFFKAENLQKVGAFKARGASYAISRLSAKERERGLLTYSSGNHAQAVARAAKLFGATATVFMPENAPGIKVTAVLGYGAKVIRAGTTSEQRRIAALSEAAQTGAAIIEPFDHPHIIAGQGTAALEFLREVPHLDALYVPVGGGGVASGSQLAALALGERVQIVGVEPSAACSLHRSLLAGEPVPVEPGKTVADGLKPVRIGERPFAILRSSGAICHLVADVEILQAMRDLLTYAKLLVEPSGAAGLAACRDGPGNRIGVILTGGNADLAALGK